MLRNSVRSCPNRKNIYTLWDTFKGNPYRNVYLLQEYLLEILLMTLRICLCQPIRENWQFPISGKTVECFARYFAIVLQAPHEIKRDTAVFKITIVCLNPTHHGPCFTTHSYIFVIQYCPCIRQHLFIFIRYRIVNRLIAI